MIIKPLIRLSFVAAVATVSAFSMALDLKVTVHNIAPSNGVFLTPVWFGIHDGNFDSFSVGTAASAGLESIAEDGSPALIGSAFMASGFGSVGGVLNGIGPIGPGSMTSKIVSVDPNDPKSRYFSFLSMVIPSNDAFVGNDNARQYSLFNEAGQFIGADFIVLGSRVFDAGTEVNDEIPANTAFLGQSAPNTGVTENGVVGFHQGFINGGNILNAFPGADFTQPDYQIARISVESVPEPFSLIALGLGAAALVKRKRKA